MRDRDEIELAIERSWTHAGQSTPSQEGEQKRLLVTVLFTSAAATVAALKTAAGLATQLQADVTLLVPQIVPYPLPLTSPPVLIGFNENRFRELAESARVKTDVQIYLCRDRDTTVVAELAAGSLVVLGVKRRNWFSSEMRLARKLRRAGHDVLITEVN